MSVKQVIQTAADFVSFYPNDPISQVKLFFTKCRLGYFGSAYGSIDEPTIMTWYRKFKDEIFDYYGEDILGDPPPSKTALPQAEEGPNVPMPESFYERFHLNKDNKKPSKNDNKAKTPEQKMLEARHNALMKELHTAKTQEERAQVIARYS